MEALGAVSSVFAIYNQLEECGKRLHRLKHNFRIAEQEVNLLADEVSACQSLFGIFKHISRPLENRVMQLARDNQLEETLNSQTTFAFGQIGDILMKLEPLKKDTNASRFDQFVAKLRWHLTKDEVQVPLITLSSVKISLTAFTCLLVLDSSVADLKSPSISDAEKESLILQIKQLRRTINRQERCLRRVAKKMSEFIDTNSQPKFVINAKSMVIIIQQMKEEPIAEAQDVIRDNLSDSPIHTLTPSRQTPLASRTVFITPLSEGASDISGSLARSSHRSETVLSPQTGALVIRKDRRQTRSVFHDYGDGNKETFEIGSSASSHPSRLSTNSDVYQSAYVPVPPFNISDWQLRKQTKREV